MPGARDAIQVFYVSGRDQLSEPRLLHPGIRLDRKLGSRHRAWHWTQTLPLGMWHPKCYPCPPNLQFFGWSPIWCLLHDLWQVATLSQGSLLSTRPPILSKQKSSWTVACWQVVHWKMEGRGALEATENMKDHGYRRIFPTFFQAQQLWNWEHWCLSVHSPALNASQNCRAAF